MGWIAYQIRMPQLFATMAHKVANDILIGEFVELLAGGQDVVFTPTGVSMRPYIEGGQDSVRLRHCDQWKIGDIALAKYGEIYVLHRIIEIKEDLVILMGDGNLQGTEQVGRGDLIAKVVEIHSEKGKRKIIGNGYIWRKLLPLRRILLKIYRKLL